MHCVSWECQQLIIEIFNTNLILFADFYWLILLLFIGLNFDFLWHEFLRDNLFGQTLHHIGIGLQLDVEHKGKNVSSCLDELDLKGVVEVEGNYLRGSLQT